MQMGLFNLNRKLQLPPAASDLHLLTRSCAAGDRGVMCYIEVSRR